MINYLLVKVDLSVMLAEEQISLAMESVAREQQAKMPKSSVRGR